MRPARGAVAWRRVSGSQDGRRARGEDPAAEQRARTPHPAHHFSAGDGRQSFDIPLTKTEAGSPDIGVAGTQFLTFGKRAQPEWTTTGSYAIYINIVHVPASKEKANLRRLRAKLGTPTPQNNPAETAQLNFANQGRGGKVPGDGCHPY
ncbi:MAG: hypothetical protein QOF55_2203 [Thermoleophilaceae bacterium]|nr:hypothetical protein [Thermoleophilaceae bacterium]